MNLLNLFDIVDAVAAQKQSEQPTDNVVDVPATVQASQANGQPATIVVPVAAASDVEVLEDDHEDSLNIGDEVIIAGNVQYQGKTGRIVDFGRNKHFVIVDLYNFGKHSFHSSNVAPNDYADSEEEDADWRERDYGLFGDDERDEVDEGEANSSIFAATKDLEQLPPGMGRGHDFGPQIAQWKDAIQKKYSHLGDIEFKDLRRHIPKDGSWSTTAIVKNSKTGNYVILGNASGNAFRPEKISFRVYNTPQEIQPERERIPSDVNEASSDWEDEAEQAERFYQMVVKKLSAINSPGERESVAGQLSKIEQKYFGARPTDTLSNRVAVTPIVNSVIIALRAGRTPTANTDNNNPNGVIAVGQRPQTGIAGREKPMFDRTSREAKKFLANAHDEILNADEGYELVKVVDALSRNQINNFRDVDWQEIDTEFGPMVATADILVLVNKLGKNPSTDDVEVDDQEEVAEGAEFGAYYYEQLAQKVFDKYPNLSTKGGADELLDAGWKIAAQDLGVKQARYMFNYDEDFTGDFVSAYAWLQKGGEQAVGEGYTEPTPTGRRHYATYGDETPKKDPLDHLDRQRTNRIEKALGVKFDREKAYQGGVKVDEETTDVYRKVFKKNGKPVGEVGIDLEASPGNGDWYVKHYASGTNYSGYDTRQDAVGELKYMVRQGLDEQGVAEGSSNVRYKAHPTKKTHIVVTQVPAGHKGIKVGDEIARSDIKGWKGFSAERKKQGVAEGEYDDPRWEPREPDMSRKVDWDIEAERNAPEEKSEPTTVTVKDADGNVVLTFPSTGGFYGDKRLAASKGFDTETGDYTMKWKRDTNEGNNWLDTPVSEEFDRIKKLAGLK